MKNWLLGTVALAICVSIGGISYLMRKPAEYTSAKLGKSILMPAVSAIEKGIDGNSPMELQCSRKSEPVGSEPVVVVCTGTGNKGHFTAAFLAATHLPHSLLQGKRAG